MTASIASGIRKYGILTRLVSLLHLAASWVSSESSEKYVDTEHAKNGNTNREMLRKLQVLDALRKWLRFRWIYALRQVGTQPII
jgi:hypothetical protein